LKVEHGIASRRLAVEVLMQMDTEGTFVNAALSNAFDRKELAARDKAFVTALVMGVTRQRLQIDEVIARQATRKPDKMPKLLLNILRVGIFQLDNMPDIPPSAVIDTSCQLARRLGHQGLVTFTNGLLRNYVRQKDSQKPSPIPSLEDGNGADSLATKYGVPSWMVQNWINNYGEKDTVGLLEYAQRRPPLVLRTCSLAITPEGLQNILSGKKIVATPGLLVPNCLIVTPTKSVHGPPQSLPGFAEGLFAIQDEASAFVSIVVDPKPGEFVVDLCAAPGGKSLHLAELMENTGQLLAIDKSATKLELLKENRQRLGLTNIQIKSADGASLALERPADRILVDAPCLGTGVLNRRPDQRTHKKSEDLQRLVEIQRRLLTHAASLVRVGGSLVYSTCSIEPEENVKNIEWFLANNPNFQAQDISGYLPIKALEAWSSKESSKNADSELVNQAKAGMIQLLPSRHDVSGFFVSKLLKEG
jgi:16S rRNA (cytosine967-C5)-methyltransferase